MIAKMSPFVFFSLSGLRLLNMFDDHDMHSHQKQGLSRKFKFIEATKYGKKEVSSIQMLVHSQRDVRENTHRP